MKVIDLLNKIANGEDVPNRIRWLTDDYWYNETLKNYSCPKHRSYLFCGDIADRLDMKVEIIEENKGIEKLNCQDEEEYSKWYLAKKIDEIIDELNKLKMEGKK